MVNQTIPLEFPCLGDEVGRFLFYLCAKLHRCDKFLQAICAGLLSLPMRGAWIEIGPAVRLHPQQTGLSLPMRGAWIEMPWTTEGTGGMGVAPHEGSVD